MSVLSESRARRPYASHGAALAGCVLAAVALGCLPSFDEYSGGVREPEAGAAMPEAGAGETGAPATEDGGLDGGELGPIVCPLADPTVILCEDFEKSDPTMSPDWEKVVTNLLATEPGVGRGGSRGLHARQDGTDTTSWGTSSGIARDIELSSPVDRTIVVSFSFAIHQAASDVFTLVELQLGDAVIGLSAYQNLECPNGQRCLTSGNRYAETLPWADAAPLELDAWHRADIMVSTTSGGRTGRVAVDGHVVRDLPGLTDDAEPTSVYMRLGALFGTTTSELYIDDLVVRRIDGP